MFNLLLTSIISKNIYFVLCGVLTLVVLLGIYLMSKVKTSVLGNRLSAVSMLLGIALTIVYYELMPFWILYVAMGIGLILGLVLAYRVTMIAMPQMIALLNGLGGAVSAIVGGFALMGIGADINAFAGITSMLAILVGMLTLIGSLVAAGKLSRVLSQKPVTYKNHQLWVIFSLVMMVVLIVLSAFLPTLGKTEIYLLAGVAILISGVFGWLFAIRVGGADMPITISLLNSLSGVAGAIAGLAIQDVLLVAVGGIVGASGLLLTQIMCRSMNRALFDILLGKTTVKENKDQKAAPQEQVKHEVKERVMKDPIEILKNAKSVIIVPGYGMAIAQAQHLVKQLQDQLVKQGASVKYAIHPVAGRMPGHMNVLLAEANVDYDDLYELDDINDEFKNVDVAIVVGANDTLNPSAREAEGTPIYGMPILNVDQAKEILVFNYDRNPGYAGVNNPIYDQENATLILGNAAETLKDVLSKL